MFKVKAFDGKSMTVSIYQSVTNYSEVFYAEFERL